MDGSQPQPRPQRMPVPFDIHDPLRVGEEGEVPPSTEQVLEVVSILTDAGITCCIVQIYALIYYGAPRVSSDRVICVRYENHQRAVQLFESRSDILKPCGPLPDITPSLLNHRYPRFKTPGLISFWQLVPESYCHIECRPENIEWSLGGIPYPKLHILGQASIDIKQGVDIECLIDGMDLTEEWGEENLNLEGATDTPWLGNYYQTFRDGFRERGLATLNPEQAKKDSDGNTLLKDIQPATGDMVRGIHERLIGQSCSVILELLAYV